jgi:hypothetical protein
MTNQPKSPGDNAPPPPFHVELNPLPAEGPLFHALHGAVPAPAVPHLPSKLEDEITRSPSKP